MKTGILYHKLFNPINIPDINQEINDIIKEIFLKKYFTKYYFNFIYIFYLEKKKKIKKKQGFIFWSTNFRLIN